MKLAFCLFAAVLVASGAQAQTPRPPLNFSSVYDHPGLQKKITLSLTQSNINQVSKELGKTTGLGFVVERNLLRPEKVADVKITDLSAGVALDKIAPLFGCRWTRRGSVIVLAQLPPTPQERMNDMMKMGEAGKKFYEKELSDAQRAKLKQQGYLQKGDFSPDQQKWLVRQLSSQFHWFTSMASGDRSRTINRGLTLDPETGVIGIREEDPKTIR